MDALEAVIDLVKTNEDLTNTLENYESWFSTLLGETVTIAHKHKKKTRFSTAEVEEFEPGEGWLARDIETDEMLSFTFEDFAIGNVWVIKKPEPVPRLKRQVPVEEDEE